jgi:hypothetical protein
MTDADAPWPPRYAGKPILVFIENYALDVIGELPPAKREGLSALTRRTWDGGDDWKATLRRVLAWPDSIDDEIRSNWASFREAAKREAIVADPIVFARAFGDEMERRATAP